MRDNGLHYSAPQILSRFCVAGIDYHHAGTGVRGLFAVDHHRHQLILSHAKERKLRSVFVLSTCNRTEIYGYTRDVNVLVDLLTAHTKGNKDEFLKYAYLLSGKGALQHIYRVAAGIDSQILGDYEILGQLKRAVEFARQQNTIGQIMDRTLNYVLQASKKVKKETAISAGTVSVSYAAIELLKEVPEISDKKILLIGAGKIGKSVCKNLKNHLKVNSIKVVNRTKETAAELANDLHVEHDSFEKLPLAIGESDVIILCTNARKPVILPAHLQDRASFKLILDLSVPVNVHSDVKHLDHVRLIDVDEISTTILDKTLAMRELEVPKAMEIIEEHQNKFWEWLLSYKNSIHLKYWKEKLSELSGSDAIKGCEMAAESLHEQNIQKMVNRLAKNLQSQVEKGCMMINTVNEYLDLAAKKRLN